jgi:hypothetical protein
MAKEQDKEELPLLETMAKQEDKEEFLELHIHLLSGGLLCTLQAQPSWKGRHVQHLVSQQSRPGTFVKNLVCEDSILNPSSTVAEMKLRSGSVLHATIVDDLSDVLRGCLFVGTGHFNCPKALKDLVESYGGKFAKKANKATHCLHGGSWYGHGSFCGTIAKVLPNGGAVVPLPSTFPGSVGDEAAAYLAKSMEVSETVAKQEFRENVPLNHVTVALARALLDAGLMTKECEETLRNSTGSWNNSGLLGPVYIGKKQWCTSQGGRCGYCRCSRCPSLFERAHAREPGVVIVFSSGTGRWAVTLGAPYGSAEAIYMQFRPSNLEVEAPFLQGTSFPPGVDNAFGEFNALVASITEAPHKYVALVSRALAAPKREHAPNLPAEAASLLTCLLDILRRSPLAQNVLSSALRRCSDNVPAWTALRLAESFDALVP